jgi:hypothetical protein
MIPSWAGRRRGHEFGAGVGVVSYSHRDREWLRRLLVLLNPVVRNRRLKVWADEYIPVGDDWQRAIDGAVDRAALGLLLVSGDFLASRFIVEVELPALIERRVRLAPVLVHDCLWEHEPLLTGVQWAHDPGQDGPLDLAADREGERDRRPVSGRSDWTGDTQALGLHGQGGIGKTVLASALARRMPCWRRNHRLVPPWRGRCGALKMPRDLTPCSPTTSGRPSYGGRS